MKVTALIMRPGEWRLLRDVNGGAFLDQFEDNGWRCKATWSDAPSIVTVLEAARRHRAWDNM